MLKNQLSTVYKMEHNTNKEKNLMDAKIHSEDNPPPTNPLEMPQIVEKLITFFNKSDLWKCRTVCKLWYGEVYHFLIKNPELCKEVQLYRYEQKNFLKFPILLSNSKNPDILFKNIILHDSYRCDFDNSNPFKTPMHEKMFYTFGRFMTKLDLYSHTDFNNILNKCLGPNAFCPHLEILGLGWLNWDKDVPLNRQPLVEFGPLKLRKIILRNLKHIQISETFEKILKNSPQIISLDITNQTVPSIADTTSLILDVLLAAPYMTKNLNELIISGNILDNWKKLGEIQFGKNFKSVTLHHFETKSISFFQTTMDEREKGLHNFLDGVCNSLESFKLNLFDNINVGHIFNLDHLLHDIPLMLMLKSLSFTGDCWGPLNNFGFLENLPLLRKLTVPNEDDFGRFLKNVLTVANPRGNVPFVHKNLELVYCPWLLPFIPEMDNVSMIHKLFAVFPKYSEIMVNVYSTPKLTGAGPEMFQTPPLFEAIAKMSNLKILNIYFQSHLDGLSQYNPVEMIEAFSYLKTLQNLEILRISAFKNVDIEFLRKPLLEIINATPRLNVIELIDLKNNENLERQIGEIINLSVGYTTIKVSNSNAKYKFERSSNVYKCNDA